MISFGRFSEFGSNKSEICTLNCVIYNSIQGSNFGIIRPKLVKSIKFNQFSVKNSQLQQKNQFIKDLAGTDLLNLQRKARIYINWAF